MKGSGCHLQGMHLHMSYSCLTDSVHHRKLQRLVGPYVSYLMQSVKGDGKTTLAHLVWFISVCAIL